MTEYPYETAIQETFDVETRTFAVPRFRCRKCGAYFALDSVIGGTGKWFE